MANAQKHPIFLRLLDEH